MHWQDELSEERDLIAMLTGDVAGVAETDFCVVLVEPLSQLFHVLFDCLGVLLLQLAERLDVLLGQVHPFEMIELFEAGICILEVLDRLLLDPLSGADRQAELSLQECSCVLGVNIAEMELSQCYPVLTDVLLDMVGVDVLGILDCLKDQEQLMCMLLLIYLLHLMFFEGLLLTDCLLCVEDSLVLVEEHL